MDITVELSFGGRTRSVHDHLGTGVDNFGTVQFQYTRYMPIQPVLIKQRGCMTSIQFLDHFGTLWKVIAKRLRMVFVWQTAVCLTVTH